MFRQKFLPLTVCFSILLIHTALAQGVSPKAARPEEEKRSVIVTTEGYAFLGGNMTLNDARKAAFTDAKQKACERGVVEIESNTLVKNGILEYALDKSQSDCGLRILEEKELGIEQGNRYHVQIRAHILYTLLDREGRKAPPGGPADGPAAPLVVRVWTEKKAYRQGEAMTIYLKGNRRFYGKIVAINSAGEMLQLLPNIWRTSHQFDGGKRYRVPDPAAGDKFEIRVTRPPYGRELIMVFASEAPLGQLPLKPSGGLFGIPGTRGQMEKRVRTIEPTPATGGAPEFYEAVWVVETKP